jgi:transcriptional regulator with XRE-family HTH domain
MAMGKRIEAERTARGWTQSKLADLVSNGAEGGLTQQALDRLEKRDSDKSEHAVGLADALGVSLRWLLSGTGRRDDKDWPFQRVNRARWDACDDVDRGYVQAAVNKALDECESNRPFATPEKPQVLAA